LEAANAKQTSDAASASGSNDDEVWTVDEMERFLLFMAKVFMLQFPLYAGPKQVRKVVF
jgi:hypothetical protein